MPGMSAAEKEAGLVEAIAQRVVQLQRGLQAPVLTLAEAISYTKHESDSAFYRWCDKWQVSSGPTGGRYARRALDRALEREAAAGTHRPKKAA